MLHRLNIDQKSNNNGKIRITFLSRNTKYRNVLNENELITAIKNHSQYEVKKVFLFKLMYRPIDRQARRVSMLRSMGCVKIGSAY